MPGLISQTQGPGTRPAMTSLKLRPSVPHITSSLLSTLEARHCSGVFLGWWDDSRLGISKEQYSTSRYHRQPWTYLMSKLHFQPLTGHLSLPGRAMESSQPMPRKQSCSHRPHTATLPTQMPSFKMSRWAVHSPKYSPLIYQLPTLPHDVAPCGQGPHSVLLCPTPELVTE